MNKKLITLAIVMLTGCATQPDKIQSAYVSPVQYKDYDCDQISAESARVGRRASDLQASLKTTADNDGAQMAVGMSLFWPALFFLEGGDGPEAAEYARLKGERDALDQVAVQKKCLLPTNAAITSQTDGATPAESPSASPAAAPSTIEETQAEAATEVDG